LKVEYLNKGNQMSHRTIFEPDNHTARDGKGGERESQQGATLAQRYANNQQLAESFATGGGLTLTVG
jgi:hypothetical protein